MQEKDIKKMLMIERAVDRPTFSLQGKTDAENRWHHGSVTISGISRLRFRFRGMMSKSNEDANVNTIRVTAK